jgi:hypothetical protein
MKSTPLSITSAALCLATSLFGQTPVAPQARTYHVEQTVTLSDIPADAKSVKWWITIPGDDRFQEVLDFSVASAPASWSVVRDPAHGGRFVYLELANPGAASVTAKIDFVVRRRSVFVEIDPAKVGTITDANREMFAEELRRDSPHMEVTQDIAAMADKACGAEANLAKQARLLLTAVADSSHHYSQDPTKPRYSVGDAESCMAHGGGTCTDIHSLFIALARARGIPARLQMGYRLRETNEGKDVDPGYRCWAEYFMPGYGWVPTDLVEANDPKGLGRDRWFSGLTERRLWLNEGREFDLAGRAATSHRVNTMIIGYAEIDGVEARVLPDGGKAAQLSRKVNYTEVRPDAPAKVLADNSR